MAIAAVPTKFVGGYLEAYFGTLPRTLPATFNHIFEAFATIDSAGNAVFTPTQNAASLIADIAARNAAGKSTLLSLGGAGGAACGLNPGSQVANFMATVVPIIDQYGFSGVDWDIEAGVNISVAGVSDISRQLKARYGANWATSMAPYGIPSIVTSYKQIANSVRDILTFVGYQYYNDSVIPTSASVIATMEEWMRDCQLRPDQWALGFLHIDDYLHLDTPYATMQQIYRDVNTKYPTVRGVWSWGLTEKEQPTGYPFASSMAQVVNTAAAPPPAVTPTPVQVQSIPFDAAAHRWLCVADGAGLSKLGLRPGASDRVYFLASPTGVSGTWTVLYSDVKPPWATNLVRANFGTYITGTGTSTAVIDNVNTFTPAAVTRSKVSSIVETFSAPLG